MTTGNNVKENEVKKTSAEQQFELRDTKSPLDPPGEMEAEPKESSTSCESYPKTQKQLHPKKRKLFEDTLDF